MAVNKISSIPSGVFLPAGASGSQQLDRVLFPGMYEIETDTTQSINASAFYLETQEGFRVGATIRGGKSYLTVSSPSDLIYIDSGTFPMAVTFTRTAYAIEPAPSASATQFDSLEDTRILDFQVDLPTDAIGLQLYWADGSSASFSSSAASVSLPIGIDFPTDVGFAALDPRSVPGKTTSINVEPSLFIFLSSDAFIPPATATTADVYLLGGGGGTESVTLPVGVRGGGGGGLWSFVPAVPISGSVSVVVGAGGNAAAGNATLFGSASVAGGGVDQPTFVGGTSGSGEPGGTGISPPTGIRRAGGGGGHTAAGVNATPTKAGDGGAGEPALTSGFLVSVGGGGGGGKKSTDPTGVGLGVDGGGNGGNSTFSPAPNVSQAGFNGAANRGGGGGGGASNQPTTLPGSSGGSGRVVVKITG